MTEVGLVDSFKYGGKMFLYVLGVLIVSVGVSAVGGVLVTMGLQDGINPLPLAGGAIIGLIGAVFWIVGTYALVHKFIADSVSAGVSVASPADSVSPTRESTTVPDSPSDRSEVPEQPPASREDEQPTASREDEPSPPPREAGRSRRSSPPREESAPTEPVDSDRSSGEPSTTTTGERPPRRSRSGTGASEQRPSSRERPASGQRPADETNAPRETSERRRTDPHGDRDVERGDASGGSKSPRSPPDEDRKQRERTAEEIAFGRSSDDTTGGSAGEPHQRRPETEPAAGDERRPTRATEPDSPAVDDATKTDDPAARETPPARDDTVDSGTPAGSDGPPSSADDVTTPESRTVESDSKPGAGRPEGEQSTDEAPDEERGEHTDGRMDEEPLDDDSVTTDPDADDPLAD